MKQISSENIHFHYVSVFEYFLYSSGQKGVDDQVFCLVLECVVELRGQEQTPPSSLQQAVCSFGLFWFVLVCFG